MLNLFSIILIFFIVFFLLSLKRKYIINALRKKNLSLLKKLNKQNYPINSSPKINHNFHYQNHTKKYSEFDRKALREEMYKLYKGQKEDKLKALNIAEELADNSTLPLLRRGLKDMNPEIVELSAILIRKFK